MLGRGGKSSSSLLSVQVETGKELELKLPKTWRADVVKLGQKGSM